jgi:hypothetical protein
MGGGLHSVFATEVRRLTGLHLCPVWLHTDRFGRLHRAGGRVAIAYAHGAMGNARSECGIARAVARSRECRMDQGHSSADRTLSGLCRSHPVLALWFSGVRVAVAGRAHCARISIARSFG